MHVYALLWAILLVPLGASVLFDNSHFAVNDSTTTSYQELHRRADNPPANVPLANDPPGGPPPLGPAPDPPFRETPFTDQQKELLHRLKNLNFDNSFMLPKPSVYEGSCDPSQISRLRIWYAEFGLLYTSLVLGVQGYGEDINIRRIFAAWLGIYPNMPDDTLSLRNWNQLMSRMDGIRRLLSVRKVSRDRLNTFHTSAHHSQFKIDLFCGDTVLQKVDWDANAIEKKPGDGIYGSVFHAGLPKPPMEPDGMYHYQAKPMTWREVYHPWMSEHALVAAMLPAASTTALEVFRGDMWGREGICATGGNLVFSNALQLLPEPVLGHPRGLGDHRKFDTDRRKWICMCTNSFSDAPQKKAQEGGLTVDQRYSKLLKDGDGLGVGSYLGDYTPVSVLFAREMWRVLAYLPYQSVASPGCDTVESCLALRDTIAGRKTMADDVSCLTYLALALNIYLSDRLKVETPNGEETRLVFRGARASPQELENSIADYRENFPPLPGDGGATVRVLQPGSERGPLTGALAGYLPSFAHNPITGQMQGIDAFGGQLGPSTGSEDVEMTYDPQDPGEGSSTGRGTGPRG